MKRNLMLLLLCSALCLTAGCAKREQPQPAESEQEVLTLYTLTSRPDCVQQAVDAFNEENEWNVRIEITMDSMDNYKLQLPVEAAAGELPDIFFTWEAGFLEPLVHSGKVLPIAELPNGAALLDRYAPETLEPLRFDGEVYAAPLGQSLAVVFYNKDVFDEAGLAVPQTWDEFLTDCETLKARGITPLLAGSADWQAGQLLLALAAGAGGREQTERFAGTAPWRQEDAEQCVQLLQSLYTQGYVQMNTDGKSVSEGTAGMYLGGDWLMNFYWNKPQIGAFLLPAVDAQYAGTCIHSVDQCYAVSADCVNREAAAAFLELLTGEEYQRCLMESYGQYPGTALKVDTFVNELQREDFQLYDQIRESVIWMDRGVGSDVGTAFNRMAMAILSGRGASQALEEFRAAAGV